MRASSPKSCPLTIRSRNTDSCRRASVSSVRVVERDENVPRPGLPDHLPFVASPLDELHQMEPARAADGIADVHRLQALSNGIAEHRREIGGLSPAEVAAFERLLSIGMGHRHAWRSPPRCEFPSSTRSARSRASSISSVDAPSGTAIRMCPIRYRCRSASAPRLSIIEM